MSFEESLQRTLDPDGLYWGYPGDADDDPARKRCVEVRLDVPREHVSDAVGIMSAADWTLSADPDSDSDPIPRLYFRRELDLLPGSRRGMLTEALSAAYQCNGRFWSWINVEEEQE